MIHVADESSEVSEGIVVHGQWSILYVLLSKVPEYVWLPLLFKLLFSLLQIIWTVLKIHIASEGN